ncbi:hypothetical protein [Halomonas salinarum]|uniref:hypothetical protein n=1 Tax=Halomonas salinarum TaxID=1158993 RepID=UPI00143C3F60|nr:hypothetical protein [Halomonas salinarum]
MLKPRRAQRLVALVILAALLFTPPLILLADKSVDGGLSWLAAYLFVSWALVIGLAAWLLERVPED